jgi:hypothetical protein
MRATEAWRNASPAARATSISVGAIDLGLRAWALFDLRKRRPDQVNGPKPAWAVGLSLVSSAGVLPLVYLIFGRRRAEAA